MAVQVGISGALSTAGEVDNGRMASPDPSDVPVTRGVPSDLTHAPAGVSHLRRYVSLRGPNARMWIAVGYFSVILTAGFLVVLASTFLHVINGETTVGSVALWASASLAMMFIGPVSNVFVLRGLPQRITRQGISADSDGVIVLQERKWWFPGEGTFIAWPEIRRVREETVVAHRTTYFIEFSLDTHRTEAELPSWAENAAALGLAGDPDAATQFYVQVPADLKEKILRMIERTSPFPDIVRRVGPKTA
ncbi:hypothetical protein SAMN05421803_11499 [Nocardiopsis flavescens]|uniref:Uncharacterized protein n=2 Tax=Nocardiopsis flavescens TaxID=758803 RepID=A0A1M6Q4W2_9ACTN|nr:hypothetical protein SAMN05421803_11499 [Nocardiopsis flavescens]